MRDMTRFSSLARRGSEFSERMGTALMIISSTHSGKRLVSLAVSLLLFAVSGTFYRLSMAAAADTPQSAGKIDEQRLLGHWVRPDGGYVLELKEIGKDGTLKAAYFNPRPINVAKADCSAARRAASRYLSNCVISTIRDQNTIFSTTLRQTG